jgi:cell division transport system permease protein
MSRSETADAQSGRKRGHRILPREAGAAPLDFVIGVMAFLAALALGGVLIANRTAQGWESGLAGRLTVQILPQGDGAPPKEVDAALRVLHDTAGVASANLLSTQENLALVAPWLGHDADVMALPFPALIDVVLAPGATPDLDALGTALKRAAPHASLDDHRRWVAKLRDTASTVVWGAAAILLLIALATAATVAFATRAGLEAHHDIVQLLHLMGAKDGFIARAFEWHYFLAALIAAAVGAALALGGFIAAGGLEQVGLPGVPFLPPLSLRLSELPWLLLVPTTSALIAWITARLSVFAALKEFY